MDRPKALKHTLSYLKSHFIHFYQDLFDGVGRITMVYNYKDCPDEILESCIYFYSNCMECRV